MCSEGMLTLKDLFTSEVDGYNIFWRLSRLGPSVTNARSALSNLVRFTQKINNVVSNQTDHSSFLKILRFLFLLLFFLILPICHKLCRL